MADKTKTSPPITAREAAYLAVLGTLRDHQFVEQALASWQLEHHPTPIDYAFAQEIAYGAVRMAMALDHLAAQLASNKKLQLKPKEKALVRTALYQHRFMDRVPLYAIVNESVTLAKKHCGTFFAKFLHAILRQLETASQTLPEGDNPQQLSIAFSYPIDFVNDLIRLYGIETAKEIMKIGNKPGPVMTRIRQGGPIVDGLRILKEGSLPLAIVEDKKLLSELVRSKDYYIQNVTPVVLLEYLADGYSPPRKVLDLCAAPGGKTLAIHDLFPGASLSANDVSEKKLRLLRENFDKYQIDVQLSESTGEMLQTGELYDLIIIDAPCSNSGVLNKRPEARWRLDEAHYKALQQIQCNLIAHAANMLRPEGQIWYMTCSILYQENEWVVEHVCKANDLELVKSPKTILPNSEGWDGGFACALRKLDDT